MVQAANVSQLLQDSSSQFTVFSPVNSAIESAIANNAVICQTDNFLDQPCTSLNDLFNSTSLSELVMNYGEQKCIAWPVHQQLLQFTLVQSYSPNAKQQ